MTKRWLLQLHDLGSELRPHAKFPHPSKMGIIPDTKGHNSGYKGANMYMFTCEYMFVYSTPYINQREENHDYYNHRGTYLS